MGVAAPRLNQSGACGLVLVDGDERVTFEEFFRERYVEVVRSMRLMIGDHARAEEVTQEAFTRACRHWRRVRTLDRPVAWVYVVATNEARRTWRREQRAESAAAPVDTRTMDDTTGPLATALDVRAALGAADQSATRDRGAAVRRRPPHRGDRRSDGMRAGHREGDAAPSARTHAHRVGDER